MKENDTKKEIMFTPGEEVFDVKAPETRAVVTRCTEDTTYVMFSDGSCGEEDMTDFKKTGRKFDISSILKELY